MIGSSRPDNMHIYKLYTVSNLYNHISQRRSEHKLFHTLHYSWIHHNWKTNYWILPIQSDWIHDEQRMLSATPKLFIIIPIVTLSVHHFLHLCYRSEYNQCSTGIMNKMLTLSFGVLIFLGLGVGLVDVS